MALSTSVHDLRTLIRSCHPLIVIETVEEERVLELLQSVAAQERMPLFEWTVLRPGPADQILHRPSFTGRQQTSKGASRRGAMSCQSLLEFDRNFCQECPSDARL